MSKIKKFSIILLLALFIAPAFLAPEVAHADLLQDFGKWMGDAFSTGGDQGLSFTQYEGGITQLSAEGYDSALTSSSSAKEFILKVVNFALQFLGLIAVLIVIYGGVLYVTAAGNDEQTQTGKKAILYAVIGLLIVLGSFAFVNTIISGVQDGQDGSNLAEQQGVLIAGAASGGGFNATAEEVRSVALNIFGLFSVTAESFEEVENIINDAEKSSLDPANLPPKGDIISFLLSTQSKLRNMKGKLPSLSEASTTINELLRQLEKDLDQIEGLREVGYYKKGKFNDFCEHEGEFEDGFYEGFFGENKCAYDGYTKYIDHLPKNWQLIRERYLSLDPTNPDTNEALSPNFGEVLTAVSENFALQFNEELERLSAVENSISSFQASGGGSGKTEIGAALEDVHRYYGYSLVGTNSVNDFFLANSGQIVDSGNFTLEPVENIKESMNDAAAILIKGLEAHAKFYDLIQKLQFVEAKLTANTVEGNAPLTVLFNGLATKDPAGGSLKAENILWDLAGTKTIDDLLKANNYGFTEGLSSPFMTCTTPTNDFIETLEEASQIGGTAQRCRYNIPGTYTAAIKVRSNNPEKYAPGISVLKIVVKPPKTKINLSVDEVIMHQYEPKSDILLIDRKKITVSKDEATKDGVVFNAFGTGAEKYRWDFGDGSAPTEFEKAHETYTKKFAEAGKYEVTLEVLSALGEIDRKIFVVEVSDIVGRLSATPSEGAFVNQEVIFDASASNSNIGNIKNYKFTIEANNIPANLQQQLDIYPLEQSGEKKTLKHTFKYPISEGYKITLEVEGTSGTSTDIIDAYKVQSQPPVAIFEHQTKDSAQPGTVHLNASRSYDPDGSKDLLEYSWKISPDPNGNNWEFENNTSEISRDPIIKFKEKGDYEVTLKVTDSSTAGSPEEESDTISKTITIDNILDIAWDPSQQSTAVLDENGESELDFNFISENGIAYEIDFGDGETSTGSIDQSTGEPVPKPKHTYKQSEKFEVEVTVFDIEDNDNSLKRSFFIGDGENPIAKIKLFIDDVEIIDFSERIVVSTSDRLVFDGSDSINLDGTGRKLEYSWNFGDTEKSSKKQAVHKYKELSPKKEGFYTVELQVRDKDDSSLESKDKIEIDVVNKPPRFTSIQAIPLGDNLSEDNRYLTPVDVEVKATNAEDEDGEIVKYKWWYFDLDDPDEQLGVQITKQNKAKLKIGTHGMQDAPREYGFGVEVTDADNLSLSSDDFLELDQIPTIEVRNGPNDLPEAKFNVNLSKSFTGEKIIFTSASTDSDGQIEDYIWDLEGDGFYNNEPTNKSSIEHTYQEANSAGYEVRLKVVDDKGGEDVSDPIKIYIDSLAEPPVAAFNYQVINGSQGKKINFQNNSTADEEAGAEILSFKWDFDTDSSLQSADSDGDGISDNDTDSQSENPSRLYTEYGVYKVKLSVTDNQGNSDEVIRTLKIPLADPPTAAFTYTIEGDQVTFNNNSYADAEGGAILEKYIWDFDSASTLPTADSDGDGQKNNDQESFEKSPTIQYDYPGEYQVRLRVIDNQGNEDDVVNTVLYGSETPTTPGIAGNNSSSTPAVSGLNKGITPTNPSLQAKLSSNPAPSADGILYLDGEQGTVTFNFADSLGDIEYFVFDKNIYFDTDGNTIQNDDEDFKTIMAGSWKTNFEKAWGQIVVKLTVVDKNGKQHSTLQEIRFK